MCNTEIETLVLNFTLKHNEDLFLKPCFVSVLNVKLNSLISLKPKTFKS